MESEDQKVGKKPYDEALPQKEKYGIERSRLTAAFFFVILTLGIMEIFQKGDIKNERRER